VIAQLGAKESEQPCRTPIGSDQRDLNDNRFDYPYLRIRVGLVQAAPLTAKTHPHTPSCGCFVSRGGQNSQEVKSEQLTGSGPDVPAFWIA